MARRGINFGTILGKSLKAVAKEAARQHKQAVRNAERLEKQAIREAERNRKQELKEEKNRQKQYQKQKVLNEKTTKIEKACNITIQAEKGNFEYLSLKHSSNSLITTTKFETLTQDNELDISEIINYLKLGKRLDAIEYILLESDLTYNEALKIIKYSEFNLSTLIKNHEASWFYDNEGEYEFLSPEEIFNIDVDIDYDTAKAEVNIECIPIGIQEIVSSKDPAVIQNRINNVITKLNIKWLAQLYKYHETRENNIIQEIRKQFNTILEYGLNIEDLCFSWEELLDKSLFESKLKKVSRPQLSLINIERLNLSEFEVKKNNVSKPKLSLIDIEKIKNEHSLPDDDKPQIEDYEFNFIDSLLLKTPFNQKIYAKREQFHQEALSDWNIQLEEKLKTINNNVKAAEQTNELKRKDYERNLIDYHKTIEGIEKEKNEFINQKVSENKRLQKIYDIEMENYNTYLKNLDNEKKDFINKQQLYNQKIKDKINRLKQGNPEEVEEFFKISLERSIYPFLLEKTIIVAYNSDIKAMVIDFQLPALDDMYNLTKVDYLVSKKTFNTAFLSQKDLNDLYNNTIYQICLRTIHEIFEIDKKFNNQIELLTFNGILNYLDKAIGKPKKACILSLQVSKEVFSEIKLCSVNPKECFKNLKGVGAADLSSITPVMPIFRLNKEDKRFVDSYEFLETIDTGTNLAAINWQDFENLIREVFEKEFSKHGGEVKITQASRDGGVDAVAFDPDPIRGGKIIIQAKRYTNIVGVSAVRDLYGTVMNEGANSGILVTTSNFGSDAYEFAKGKPLNLLNGSELLYLMEKHGYKAYINLQEAKKILANNPEI